MERRCFRKCFKNPSKRNQTELSKLIWNLKDAGHSPAIKWFIACRATAYCETDFKARYYNHIQSFKNPSKRNQTELSKLIWNLKDAGHSPAIKWSIACRATAYTCGMKQCHLCLSEKLAILLAKPDTLLNKRSELVAKCRHRNKFKLNKFVT